MSKVTKLHRKATRLEMTMNYYRPMPIIDPKFISSAQATFSGLLFNPSPKILMDEDFIPTWDDTFNYFELSVKRFGYINMVFLEIHQLNDWLKYSCDRWDELLFTAQYDDDEAFPDECPLTDEQVSKLESIEGWSWNIGEIIHTFEVNSMDEMEEIISNYLQSPTNEINPYIAFQWGSLCELAEAARNLNYPIFSYVLERFERLNELEDLIYSSNVEAKDMEPYKRSACDYYETR